MAGQIPQNFIDQLMDTSDLVGLIGEDVTLKNPGQTTKPNAPFTMIAAPALVCRRTNRSITVLDAEPRATS